MLSVCSPSPSRKTTEENQCKMMQWPHMVPVHPAETGPGDPLACFPASGRTSCTGRAISDWSFHSTLWGHQQPPGPWSSRQQRAPLPPPLLAAPSAPPLPPAGLAPVHPGLNRAGGSWTQPAQSVGMSLYRADVLSCVFCSKVLSGGRGWS